MANATNTISSKLVVISISTDTVTPSYKSVVCSISKGLSGSADVTSQATDCGTAKSRGSVSWTIEGSFAANTSPSGTEMSHDDLIALMQSGDDFLFKLADSVTPANYYRQGTGFFSSYNESGEVNGYIQGDFTIEVKGDLDYAS